MSERELLFVGNGALLFPLGDYILLSFPPVRGFLSAGSFAVLNAMLRRGQNFACMTSVRAAR